MSVTFHQCDCGTEALSVYQDEELIELAIWERKGYGSDSKSLRLRLHNAARAAWKELRTGSLWHDQLCLNPQSAREIAARLNEAADRAEGA